MTVYDIEYAVTVRMKVVSNGERVTSAKVTVDEFEPYYPYRAAIVEGGGDDPEFVRYPAFFDEDRYVVDHIADRQPTITFRFKKENP